MRKLGKISSHNKACCGSRNEIDNLAMVLLSRISVGGRDNAITFEWTLGIFDLLILEENKLCIKELV